MIVCCGESLIDFIPSETFDGHFAYVPANGGSPMNVAVALARLGVEAGFMGSISTDFLGDQLYSFLMENGVAPIFIARRDNPTTCAFVNLDEAEPRYGFYDEACADRMWTRSQSPAPGNETQALHFGSISLVRLPAADEYAALAMAEQPNRLITLDPNIRPGLVKDEAEFRERLETMLSLADIIKISVADLSWWTPDADAQSFAAQRLDNGAGLVVVTDGSRGAHAFNQAGHLHVPAIPARSASGDTVGAGDSFMAGLLCAISEWAKLSRPEIGTLSTTELTAILTFAGKVAAITCERLGAIPPMRSEI